MRSIRRNVSALLAAATAALVIICPSPSVSGADAPSRESLVKAAFIYNFTQFIEWPDPVLADPKTPFIVAVVGKPDKLEGAMEMAMAGKTVAGHHFEVQHYPDIASIKPCQCVYVPASAEKDASDVLSHFADKPMLSIGESDDFMKAGGGIELYVDDGHMRFKLDPDVTSAQHLKVSAKLMKLANIFKREPQN